MKKHSARKAFLTCGTAIAIATATTPASAEQREFNLPAQSATRSIPEFGRQAGVQIIAPGSVLRSVRTRSLRGAFDVRVALKQLLEGTGLRVVSDDGVTITLGLVDAVGNAGTSNVGGSQNTDVSSGEDHAVAVNDGAGKQDIVVTGTHIRGAPVTSPIIVLDKSYIEHGGYQSAGDLIRGVPQSFGGGLNLTVQSAGGSANINSASSASSPNLRGLGSDSTLTLVNGNRLAYSDGVSVTDISLIPVAAIERVDIVTDGASAIYGSDAVAGVVNFILRRDYSGAEVSGTLGTSSDGGGTLYRATALAGAKWASGGGLVNYEFAHQDKILASQRDYTDPLVAQTTLLPRTERQSVFATVHQALGNNTEVGMQTLYTARKALWQADYSQFVPGLVGANDAKVHQYGVTAYGRHDFGSNWNVRLGLTRAGNSTNAPQPLYLDGALLSTVDQRFRTSLDQADLVVSGDLFQAAGGAAKLALGATYRHEFLNEHIESDGVIYADIRDSRNVESAFAEFIAPLLKRSSEVPLLVVSAAGRYDHYSDVGSTTNPKIGLALYPSRIITLRANLGYSFRAPALAQLHAARTTFYQTSLDPEAPTGTSRILLLLGGNDSLKPEKARNISFEASARPDFLGGGSLTLSYFNIRYRDRIGLPTTNTSSPLLDDAVTAFTIRNPTAAQVAEALAGASLINEIGEPIDPADVAAIVDNRLNNADLQSVAGLDLSADLRRPLWSGQMVASFNGTYLTSHQILNSASGRQQLAGLVFNPPKFRGRLGLAWERRNAFVALNANYVGPLKDVIPSPTVRVDDWLTFDASAQWRLGPQNGPNFKIGVQVQNLFNARPPAYISPAAGLPGLNFDSTNASPLGRFMSVSVTKSW